MPINNKHTNNSSKPDRSPSIWWVNVFFTEECKSLSDGELLTYIHDYIRQESISMTATPDPMEASVGDCLSIMIDTSGVRLRKNLGVESIAYEKVQQWIRDFPKKGLPFERGKILREEGKGGALRSMKGR